MFKTTCATIALFALSLSWADQALAAGCASPAEASALKTAVMQQELMVAALQCHEAGAYNRFVVAYRPELQDLDAALKAFFVRHGGEHGEAGYDTFKTKAANLSALEQARDSRAFCADAHVLFEAALANRGSLMSFVDARSSGTDIDSICVEARPTPLPVRTATTGSLQAAPVKTAQAPAKSSAAPLKVADARSADETLAGVPAYSMPATPYRQAAAGRDSLQDQDQQDVAQPAYVAQEQEAPPPPRPRYYQVRDRDYAYDDYGNYAPPPPRPYGPPPGWSNYPAPPSYGWYPQNGYYNW